MTENPENPQVPLGSPGSPAPQEFSAAQRMEKAVEIQVFVPDRTLLGLSHTVNDPKPLIERLVEASRLKDVAFFNETLQIYVSVSLSLSNLQQHSAISQHTIDTLSKSPESQEKLLKSIVSSAAVHLELLLTGQSLDSDAASVNSGRSGSSGLERRPFHSFLLKSDVCSSENLAEVWFDSGAASVRAVYLKEMEVAYPKLRLASTKLDVIATVSFHSTQLRRALRSGTAEGSGGTPRSAESAQETVAAGITDGESRSRSTDSEEFITGDPLPPPAPVNLLESLETGGGSLTVSGHSSLSAFAAIPPAAPLLPLHGAPQTHTGLAISTTSGGPVPENTPGADPGTDQGGIRVTVSFPVVSVLLMRLKAAKPAGINESLLSLLEVESSVLLSRPSVSLRRIAVTRIHAELLGGTAEPNQCLELPIELKPRDIYTLMFTLAHAEHNVSGGTRDSAKTRPITFTIDSVPLPDGLSASKAASVAESDPKAVITTKWTTIADFGIPAPPLKPVAAAAPLSAPSGTSDHSLAVPKRRDGSRSTKASLRSSSSSLTLNIPSKQTVSPHIAHSPIPPASATLQGISVSFTGPTSVSPGQIVQWDVLVINKSSQPKRLGIYVTPKDGGLGTAAHKRHLLATGAARGPVVDHMALTRMYLGLRITRSEILFLTNDVRIGPLEPNTSFETRLKFLALRAGVFSMEGLQLVDLASGESFECGKMLEISVA